jgi:hypothetical protein
MTNALAVLNVLMGIGVVILGIVNARTAKENQWIYGFCALAGAAIAMAFILALVESIQGGPGIVIPELGRPAVTLMEGALLIMMILSHRKGN